MPNMSFLWIFLFLIGLSIGSFLNVLIDRLSAGESIRGRSYCDKCKRELAWKDLIPIISFILLKGRCRYCKAKISFYYPLVEFITGASFIFFPLKSPLFSSSGWIAQIIFLGIISCLIVIFFTDVKYQLIPDEIQIALLGFSFLWFLAEGMGWMGVLKHVFSAFLVMAPTVFLFFITKGRGIGFGDVKLAFNIGFLLGVKSGLLTLYLAFVAGGVVGLFLVLARVKGLKSKIAFGPFLVVSMALVFFWQKQVYALIKEIMRII